MIAENVHRPISGWFIRYREAKKIYAIFAYVP